MDQNNNQEIVESIIGPEALYESMMKCKKGVIWKDSVAHYYLNGIEETLKLSQQLREQYTGETGYNPGSQMVQIAGISVLSPLDHFIKEKLRIKWYMRYMDDFILLHEDKEYLEYCYAEIEKFLARHHFEPHPKKTKIYNVKKGIKFLGFTHYITETGKVIRIVNPQNVKSERKKLRRQVILVKNGLLTKKQVDDGYEAWKAHVERGNSHKLLLSMDEYYKGLWEELSQCA